MRQQDLCPALRDAAFSLTTAQKKRRGKNSFQPGKKLMPHIIGIRFQRTLRKIGCAERDFKLNCFRRFSRKDKTSGDHQAPPRFGQAFTKNLSILCVFASSWQRPGPIHHEDMKARRITKRKILARLRRISAWLLGARSGVAAAATGHRHATERAVKTAGQKAAIANHSYSGASSKDAAQSSKMGGFYGVTPSADPYLPSYWYESPEQDFTKP